MRADGSFECHTLTDLSAQHQTFVNTSHLTSRPVVSSSEKMAAVIVSADGGVASLDPDSASPRIPSPAPEQNNALLGLPIVAIENILNFLTHDEISLLRPVRKQRASASLRRV